MRQLKIFISLLFLLGISQSIFAEDTYDVNVIMIGIGAKNPTFDESKFPDLKFYYTPGLVSQAEVDNNGKALVSLLGGSTREIFKGEPEILAKWFDEMDLRGYAIVFDKNGVGTWQGKLNLEDDLIEDSEGEGEEETLEDTFEYLLEDGEIMEADEDKEFDYEDDDSVIETYMPDFEVVAPDGSKKSIRELTKNGKTTMVVFFQIPKDIDLNAAKDVQEEKDAGSFFSKTLTSVAGSNWQQLMKKIEYSIYGKEIKVKMVGYDK